MQSKVAETALSSSSLLAPGKSPERYPFRNRP